MALVGLGATSREMIPSRKGSWRKIRHKVRGKAKARGNIKMEMLQRLITISREAKKCVSYRRPSKVVTTISKSFMMGTTGMIPRLEPYIGIPTARYKRPKGHLLFSVNA